MTTPTFIPPIQPSPGTSQKPKLKIRKTEFGDGYTQYSPDGLNHMRKIIDLEWPVLSQTEAQAIIGFLETQGGYLPFHYTIPGEATPTKWTCDTWEDIRIDGGFRKISATFEQSFNLD